MMINKKLQISLILITLVITCISPVRSQTLVESIAAIVGNEVVYLSDLETGVIDRRRRETRTPESQLRCEVLEELLIANLFLDQARIDSISVDSDAVEGELNMRINEAIRSAGGEEVLVEVFGKNMIEIRRDIRESLIQQETIREVQSSIAGDVKVTPSAVRRFFSSLPQDSLPIIPAKYKISVIQLDPPSSEDNKAEARQKLLDIRSEILAGKSFSALAALNSEDPGSAYNGGEIGYMTRGELEKEYADAAFSLSKNTVSGIVETRLGFHIIQLIDRKGDMANTRHILVKPKVKPYQEARALTRLDSLANLIRKDSLNFEEMAIRYSTHKDSRINGGRMVSSNPSSRISWFTLEELNPEMYVKIRDMKIGEISDPFRTTDEDNNVVFRIIRLDDLLPAHVANLKDDYQDIYNATLMNNRTEFYNDWIREKIKTTYLKISEEYKSCPFLQEEWLE